MQGGKGPTPYHLPLKISVGTFVSLFSIINRKANKINSFLKILSILVPDDNLDGHLPMRSFLYKIHGKFTM